MSVGWRIFLGIFYQLIKRSVLPIASSGFSLKIDSEAVVQSGIGKSCFRTGAIFSSSC